MNKVFENRALQESKEVLLRRLKDFYNLIENMDEKDFERYDELDNKFEESMAIAESENYFADVEDELHKEEPENREIVIMTFIEDYGYENSESHSKFSIK